MTGKIALVTGITGQDGAYLAQLLLDKGYVVHGVKRRSSSFNTERVDDLYVDPHEGETRFFMHYGDLTDATNLIRLVQETQARRDLQSRRPEPRAGQLRDARVHRQRRRARHAAPARGDPHPEARADGALLSGLDLGALRQGAGGAAERDDAVLSALALCRGQALRLLDHGELPRGLRHPRLQRHPVQSRKPDARRDVRHAQDHPRRRRHRARPAGAALSRQSRSQARLGPCARLRRGHVADAAAGRSPTTTCWPPARCTRCASSSNWRSPRSAAGSTGAARASTRSASTPRPARRWCRSIRATSGRPRSSSCSAIRRKARKQLGWKHKTSFKELVTEMVKCDLEVVARERWRKARAAE